MAAVVAGAKWRQFVLELKLKLASGEQLGAPSSSVYASLRRWHAVGCALLFGAVCPLHWLCTLSFPSLSMFAVLSTFPKLNSKLATALLLLLLQCLLLFLLGQNSFI